jgi:hypothetical protein
MRSAHDDPPTSRAVDGLRLVGVRWPDSQPVCCQPTAKMALDAGPFMTLGTRGSPSWPGFDPETGYVDADCYDQITKTACGRGGPYVSVRCLLMSANHSAIQHEILIVRIVRQILKDSFPHACFDPAGERLWTVLYLPYRSGRSCQ